MQAKIHPSILSADFANFERDFASITNADAIHIDVMDGHFVPNLTFGLPMVRRMREITTLPLDIHLMIEKVDDEALGYVDAGAESVTFHYEATTDAPALARRIRAAGAKAAVAIKPGTSHEVLLDSLDEFDMLLVMTVEPGFGGQKFMADMLTKVEALSSAIRASGREIRLEIDGGVDLTNIAHAASCGADTFVAGSSVFAAEDRNARIDVLRTLAIG